MKESTTYQAILHEGRIEEARKLLLRQEIKKLGKLNAAISATLEATVSLRRLGPAAAGQFTAVRTERQRPDAFVGFQFADFLGGVHVVDLDHAVQVAGGKALAVGAEREGSEIAAQFFGFGFLFCLGVERLD